MTQNSSLRLLLLTGAAALSLWWCNPAMAQIVIGDNSETSLESYSSSVPSTGVTQTEVDSSNLPWRQVPGAKNNRRELLAPIGRVGQKATDIAKGPAASGLLPERGKNNLPLLDTTPAADGRSARPAAMLERGQGLSASTLGVLPELPPVSSVGQERLRGQSTLPAITRRNLIQGFQQARQGASNVDMATANIPNMNSGAEAAQVLANSPAPVIDSALNPRPIIQDYQPAPPVITMPRQNAKAAGAATGQAIQKSKGPESRGPENKEPAKKAALPTPAPLPAPPAPETVVAPAAVTTTSRKLFSSNAEQPVPEKPLVEKPVAETPTVKQSIVRPPAVEMPVVRAPVVSEPEIKTNQLAGAPLPVVAPVPPAPQAAVESKTFLPEPPASAVLTNTEPPATATPLLVPKAQPAPQPTPQPTPQPAPQPRPQQIPQPIPQPAPVPPAPPAASAAPAPAKKVIIPKLTDVAEEPQRLDAIVSAPRIAVQEAPPLLAESAPKQETAVVQTIAPSQPVSSEVAAPEVAAPVAAPPAKATALLEPQPLLPPTNRQPGILGQVPASDLSGTAGQATTLKTPKFGAWLNTKPQENTAVKAAPPKKKAKVKKIAKPLPLRQESKAAEQAPENQAKISETLTAPLNEKPANDIAVAGASDKPNTTDNEAKSEALEQAAKEKAAADKLEAERLAAEKVAAEKAAAEKAAADKLEAERLVAEKVAAEKAAAEKAAIETAATEKAAADKLEAERLAAEKAAAEKAAAEKAAAAKAEADKPAAQKAPDVASEKTLPKNNDNSTAPSVAFLKVPDTNAPGANQALAPAAAPLAVVDTTSVAAPEPEAEKPAEQPMPQDSSVATPTAEPAQNSAPVLAPAPPAETVAADKPAANTADAGVVLAFSKGAEQLSPEAKQRLDVLASELKGATTTRLLLSAYAVAAGDKDARRISLGRALAVRAYLIAKGVSGTRMDVKALGDDQGRSSVDQVIIKQE